MPFMGVAVLLQPKCFSTKILLLDYYALRVTKWAELDSEYYTCIWAYVYNFFTLSCSAHKI